MRSDENDRRLSIIGGHAGALLPFLVFMLGAIWLGMEGNADVYAYWPVISLSLLLGLILARNRTRYAEVIIEGMSQHMVMIMVSAWLFASVASILVAFIVLPLVLIPVEMHTGNPLLRLSVFSALNFVLAWSLTLYDRGLKWWVPLLYPLTFIHLLYMAWKCFGRAAAHIGIVWKGRVFK